MDFGGIFKIIHVYERYDEKLETTSTTKKQQNLKNDKVRFRLNIDVRKEMEESRLNAIEVRKRSTEF